MMHYYNDAVKLYQTHIRPGDSDPEMQQLEILVEQLYTGGWLEP